MFQSNQSNLSENTWKVSASCGPDLPPPPPLRVFSVTSCGLSESQGTILGSAQTKGPGSRGFPPVILVWIKLGESVQVQQDQEQSCSSHCLVLEGKQKKYSGRDDHMARFIQSRRHVLQKAGMNERSSNAPPLSPSLSLNERRNE